jgi:DNA-binding transcriptional MerR regulator
MSYTLGQAAKATGKAKTTIQRAVKNGRLTAQRNDSGGYRIDPAELHRVFPSIATHNATPQDPKTTILEQQLQAVQRENEMLKDHLSELRNDRDHWRQQATALLTDSRKRGFLSRLLGKN